MRTLLRRGSFISGLMLCLLPAAQAQHHRVSPLPSLEALASTPYWQRLLRDATPQSADYASPVTLNGFFLSPTGAEDALAELRATLTALANEPDASCRYPGRHAWLSQQRPDLAAHWPRPDCAELNTWLKGLDASQATLVFASDYLNNPSSMFGHTLLRIDAASQHDDTRLLSYAINYSAQTNTSNGLEFAVKGLTGGYPGAYSLLPYYEKVKEYNDWESRDLWEYELALTPAEVRQMLLVFWDWRGMTSPYYFLSRNCSYELLGLIEMARDGLDLQSQFPVAAIPTDTVRAVLATDGLLKRVTWRAASGTQLRASLARNDAMTNAAAAKLSHNAKSATSAAQALTPLQRARALEVAYDDLYARHVSRKATADAPAQLRQLLTARAVIDVPPQRVTPQRPRHDPSQGHGTTRISIGGGYDHQAFTTLAIRPAYHDWLDSTAGYRAGARIDFLTGQLRADRDGLNIEQLTVVGIDSLAPINALSTPLSWSVRLGLDRRLGDEAGPRRHSATTLEGGGGISVALGKTLCFGQSHSHLQGGAALSDGWEAATGVRAGCTGGYASQGAANWRWLVETRSLYALPAARLDHELRSAVQWNVAANQAISAGLNREWRANALTTFSLQWHRYF